MYEQLKSKLKGEGRSIKWFISVYLPNMRYNTAVAQLNDFNGMSDEVTEAIKKFMKEN